MSRIELIYVGRRVRENGRTGRFYVQPGDHESEFTFRSNRGVKGGVIGGVYSFEGEANGDSLSVKLVTSRYESKLDDPETVAGWEARDEAAAAEERLNRLESQAAADSELEAALAPLLEIAKRMRTRHERRAFRMYVEDRLGAAWWTR